MARSNTAKFLGKHQMEDAIVLISNVAKPFLIAGSLSSKLKTNTTNG